MVLYKICSILSHRTTLYRELLSDDRDSREIYYYLPTGFANITTQCLEKRVPRINSRRGRRTTNAILTADVATATYEQNALVSYDFPAPPSGLAFRPQINILYCKTTGLTGLNNIIIVNVVRPCAVRRTMLFTK